jgi:hypothetical protein
LAVRLGGTRSWILRMQHNGRRRDYGLGPTYDVSLADARCRAAELRRMVRAALDPVKERGLRRPDVPTFEMVARQCYDAIKAGWKDKRHLSWLASLENHVFPEIGAKRIDAIGSAEMLRAAMP